MFSMRLTPNSGSPQALQYPEKMKGHEWPNAGYAALKFIASKIPAITNSGYDRFEHLGSQGPKLHPLGTGQDTCRAFQDPTPRSQFHHVCDITPTIYEADSRKNPDKPLFCIFGSHLGTRTREEAVGITPPEHVEGAAQIRSCRGRLLRALEAFR